MEEDMIFKSNYGKKELISRFDDLTSEARFAGADEMNDWVFQSKRTDDRIKIVRKPKNAYDPFASVFRGKIVETEHGSAIKGVYTKSVFDYISAFIVFFIYFSICAKYYNMSEDKTNPTVMIFVGIAIILLLFSSLPHTRKRYGEFIRRVTEGDGTALSPGASVPDKTERQENAKENNTESDEKEKKNKYKFRI